MPAKEQDVPNITYVINDFLCLVNLFFLSVNLRLADPCKNSMTAFTKLTVDFSSNRCYIIVTFNK